MVVWKYILEETKNHSYIKASITNKDMSVMENSKQTILLLGLIYWALCIARTI